MGQGTNTLSQAELDGHVVAGTLWALIDAHDAHQQDPRLVETFVALHNSGRFDFLSSADQPAFVEMQSWQRWGAYALIGIVLPRVEAEAAEMMAFIARLIALGDDANGYEPRSAFEKWCAAASGRSTAVIALAEQDVDLAVANLSLALTALGSHDQARRVAQTYQDDRRFEALNALARIPHPVASEREMTLSLLEDLTQAAPGEDRLSAAVVRVLTDTIAQADQPLEPRVLALLDLTIAGGGEQTLHQVALTFMVGAPALLTPEVLTLLLTGFERVSQTNVGTVDRIDVGLRQMLERGHATQVLAFITLLAGRDEDPFALSAFDGAMRRMALGSGEQLHQAVLEWMRVGQPQICFQLSGLLQELQSGDGPWAVDMKAAGFSDQDVYFICRRAIGYFLAEEVVAASLVVGAIRTAEPSLADALTRLLVDPLLMNYGGKLRRYLETITANDPAHPYVVEALREVDEYRDDLKAEMAPELAVPSERRQLAHHLRADEMRTASKAAKKKSILADLVTNQYILYGNRTSSWIKNRDGTRRWMDSQMASHGYSYEIPRQDVLDPVGLQHRLFELRFGKPKA